MFHPAGCLAKLNGIAHGILIFKNDVKTSDQIAHEVLRAKAHGYAREPCERQSRNRVNAEKIKCSDESHHPDNFADRAVKNSCKRARLLLSGLRCPSLAGCGFND